MQSARFFLDSLPNCIQSLFLLSSFLRQWLPALRLHFGVLHILWRFDLEEVTDNESDAYESDKHSSDDAEDILIQCENADKDVDCPISQDTSTRSSRASLTDAASKKAEHEACIDSDL